MNNICKKAMMYHKVKVSVKLDNAFEAVKPKLHKVENQVAYEFLEVYNIVSTFTPHHLLKFLQPCKLNYFQLVNSLCSEMVNHFVQ